MPIKYIGRESFFHGRSLFEIARNLKKFGEGRYVYRVAFKNRYEEPSFYKLTSVKPDMNAKGYCKGQAAGEKFFRGENLGICTINAGAKLDWRLIPKDQENLWFDAIKTSETRTHNVVPLHVELPPLMKQLFMEDCVANDIEYDDSTFQAKRRIKIAKFNHAVVKDMSSETVNNEAESTLK